MRVRGRARLGACAALLAAPLVSLAADPERGVGSAPRADKGARSHLELTIESPAPDAVIGDPGAMAFLSGSALASFGAMQTFDIVFVVDVSESTSAPCGADIDGDGQIGARRGGKFGTIFGTVLPLPNSDRGDSVLAAEIAAVRTLLDQLDPRTTRVGVVAFSGDDDPINLDAFTQVALTTDYKRVHKALDELFDAGPWGKTNMSAGVRLGAAELLGTRSAVSEPRQDSRKVMLLLTDGRPTLPYTGQDSSNIREAIRAAVKSAKAGIRIDTYAIGEDALEEPIVAVEMARVSNGVFTPVREPRDLRAIFESIDFAEIAELQVKNRTTGAAAEYQLQNPDGSFSALLLMKEGRNVLEVFARATDGSQARAEVAVKFLANGQAQALSPRLVAQRNRLLENRLADLKRKRLSLQTERDEDVRRDLKLEIERERASARERSEEAKRRLDIRVEDAEEESEP